MSVDNKPELPQGYSWRDCRGVGASFPVPDGWQSKKVMVVGTVGFAFYERPDPRHGFLTGLEMNVQLGIDDEVPSLLEIVRINLAGVREQGGFSIVGEPIEEEDGPFSVVRAFMKSTSLLVHGRLMEPKRCYVEGTVNRNTRKGYLINFHTPVERWEQDEETARLMIEKRILDPNF